MSKDVSKQIFVTSVVGLIACVLASCFTGCLVGHNDRPCECDYEDCQDCEPGDRWNQSGDCPDGQCPYPRGSADGLESEDETASTLTTVESSSSCCNACPCHGAACGEAALPQQFNFECGTSGCSAGEVVVHGAYACVRCKRITAGEDWHEVRTSRGDSAMFMCEHCWQNAKANERSQYLEDYLGRHVVNDDLKERLRGAL
ncbi:MAG: hypothetical protein AAGD07_16120 [Planctomycetota bacterium]